MGQEIAIIEEQPHPYQSMIDQAGGPQKWTPTSYMRWNMFVGLQQKWICLRPYTEEWRAVGLTWRI